jgi:hypothetical protein
MRRSQGAIARDWGRSSRIFASSQPGPGQNHDGILRVFLVIRRTTSTSLLRIRMHRVPSKVWNWLGALMPSKQQSGNACRAPRCDP